ncbi:AAA family ATPase [Amycolatopsis sp. NPDC021455]|uniref:helix-turn-helix transcriptional regulator n=1 Tax=Amycolatopsis sp. NPDC021455 TaxID=3154901 RepID=UPI0033FF4830
MTAGNVPPQAFVAREAEMTRLGRLLAEAAAGRPSTAAVLGEPGVGKSRLLREFSASARASGALVLSGWCVALGVGEIPYAPLIDALRRLVRELGVTSVREQAGSAYADLEHLVADFHGEDGEPGVVRDSQLRVFGAVLRLLDLLGTDRPVVMVLEDLHWADPSTVDLVGYLARAQTDERVLLVFSYRSDLRPRHPLRTAVAELERAHRLERVELSRFTPEELRVFLGTVLGREVNHEVLGRFVEFSEGNAFFAEELVAAGLHSAGPGSDPARRLPVSLRDLVLARFELLSDDAREVMRFAATAGRQVSHRLLATVCELDDRRMGVALRECVDQQLLVTDPADDTYLFRHALLREAVHQELLPGERLRLHAAMAEALTTDVQLSYAEELTVAAELSYHWYEAGLPAQALPAAVRAGATALRLRAFREAERQYRRALELWPRLPDARNDLAVTRAQLLASAADAARWAGHVDHAVEFVRQALVHAETGHRGELLERLGSYLWEAGDSAASRRAYAEAGQLLAELRPSAVTARVLAGTAVADVRGGRYEEGLKLAGEAIEIARAVGARAEEGRALNTLGMALAALGETQPGIDALREAVRIADAADHLEDFYRAYGNLTLAVQGAGRLEESVSIAFEGLAHARRFGLEHARCGGVLANNASVALVQLGRWEQATAVIAEVLLERPVRESLYPRLTLAEIAVARGRFDEAGRLLAEVRAAGRDVDEPGFVGALYAFEAEQSIWRREYGAARAAVACGLRKLQGAEDRIALLRLYALGLRIEADEQVRLSAVRSRRGESDDLAVTVDDFARGARLAGRAGRSPLPDAPALLLQCEAERARFQGHADAARWTEVSRAWEALARPYPAAYARWREAEAAVASRERAAGAEAARAAHRATVELGAGPLRAEIEALARRARLDLAEPAPARPAVPADPFGLTRREREVLAHLVAGETNRRIARMLYITEKTASVHVSNILMKLGVTSRGEAAAVAHRLGIHEELTKEE